MLCKNCLKHRGLTPTSFSPDFCPNCRTDQELKQTKMYPNESRVLNLSVELKTLIMRIDRNIAKTSDESLIELYNLSLIYDNKVILTPKGMEWLWYLLANDTDAKAYHAKLKSSPIAG